jgi:CHAD domain-containing protein
MFGDCWKRKQVKTWKKQIGRLARDLSEARDQDVQIEFLVAKLAVVSDGILVPGIARLLSHTEQQRQWTQPRVLQAVERLEQSGVWKQMQLAARRGSRANKDALSVTSDASRRRAATSVHKQLKRLLAEAAGLASAEHCDRHHAMRIAAKRLRYALELASPRHEIEIDGFLDSIKRLQTLLGEIHDCDVWAENLAAFARSEAMQVHAFFGDSRRFDRLRPGLDYLYEDRTCRRADVFGELASFWQELCEKRFWERVIDLLKPDASAEPLGNGVAAIHEHGKSLS